MKTLQEKKIEKLINKFIERIKIDYPEDDKLMLDLIQFKSELAALDKEIEQGEQRMSAEEWLREKYPEFIIHCKATHRRLPFFTKMLEQYASQSGYPEDFVEWLDTEDWRISTYAKINLWSNDNYPYLYEITLLKLYNYWKENIKRFRRIRLI